MYFYLLPNCYLRGLATFKHWTHGQFYVFFWYTVVFKTTNMNNSVFLSFFCYLKKLNFLKRFKYMCNFVRNCIYIWKFNLSSIFIIHLKIHSDMYMDNEKRRCNLIESPPKLLFYSPCLTAVQVKPVTLKCWKKSKKKKKFKYC